MHRDEMLAQLEDRKTPWDVIVIGGGATGLGIALDSASRGYSTVLLEKGDFGQGTSSRSTKLVHGGVRYLQQGNITLVLEALKERSILKRNAPHLVHDLMFVVPNYDWWEGPFYGIGMKIYDLMAGKAGLGPSKMISKEQTLEYLPTIETENLSGGVVYYDGQFDDARLLINLAQSAAEQGAVLINYMPVIKLIKKDQLIRGVVARDEEKGREYTLSAKVIINATGPFADNICRMDEPERQPLIQPSQGTHLVLDRKFLPTDNAIMVPHTADGRVLFAIPWHQHVIIGTTETALDNVPEEPRPMPDEIDFLLEHAGQYLSRDPGPDDILSIFSGVRPLVIDPEVKSTAALSRDHVIHISDSGLLTITGGKWTTYRKMAEDVMEKAIFVGDLENRPCTTETLQIHGYHQHAENFGELQVYGSEAVEIRNLIKTSRSFQEKLHPDLTTLTGEVVWAVREEMARTVEDFLARRTRTLFLNAQNAMEMAPAVAAIMRKETGKSRKWEKEQIKIFTERAGQYLPV